MLDKIKTYQKRIPWSSLRDLRTLGLLAFLVIVLLVSWSGVKAIQSNYGLQKQIATLKQQNQVQQLKNNNLQLENDYYNTNQYLDITARQELGLGQPGETELIVPKSVALAHLAPTPQSAAPSTKPNSRQPWYQRNFQAWIDFFLHHQSTGS